MELRNVLFSFDTKKKEKARKEFLEHAVKIMEYSYGVELVKSCSHHYKHKNDRTLVGVENVDNIDKTIAHALHKSPCASVNAKLMKCAQCQMACSHHDLVWNSLKMWRKPMPSLLSVNETTPLIIDDDGVLPSNTILDMAAYTYSYHMEHGCAHKELRDKSILSNLNLRCLLKQKSLMSIDTDTQSHVGRKDRCADLDPCCGYQIQNVHNFLKIQVYQERSQDQ